MPSRYPPIPSSFRPSSSSSSSPASPSKPHSYNAASSSSSSLQRTGSRSSTRLDADMSSHGQTHSRSANATSANAGMTRPLSLTELADRAYVASDTLPFSPSVPLRRYTSGCDTLRRQAGVYRREGDRESEFICLVKCARLLIDTLPTQHPEYRELSPDARRKWKADSQNLLDQISDVKTHLNNRFEAWNRLDEHEKRRYREPDSASGSATRRQLDFEAERRSPSNSISGSIRDTTHRPSSSSSSTTASESSTKAKTPSIHFVKPDRSNDGFDLRNLVGFGAKRREMPPSGREVQFQERTVTASPASSVTAFSSDPLESFSHAHAHRARSNPPAPAPKSPDATFKQQQQYAGAGVKVLRPSLSHRMSVHQKQQGFAPSNQATARYYQTLRKSSDPPPGNAADRYPRDAPASPIKSPSSSSSSPSKSLSVPLLPPLPDGSGRRSRGPLPPLPPPRPRSQPQSPAPPPNIGNSAASSHSRTTLEEAMAQMSVGYGASQAIENDTASIRHFPTPFLTPSASTSSLHSTTTSSSYSTQQTTLSASRESHDHSSSVGKPSFDYHRTCYTEGGDALRSMEVPSSLISAFLSAAKPNTDRNLETCALLQGTLQHGAFRVSHLVFPRQTATSDSCTTQDEEDVMLFQEHHNLITLGWIHTHPTQSCFLSSLDLHTHAGYQMMLPEAIAIVCAPRCDPSFGLFRLTDPTGLRFVIACKNKGLFHPHTSEDGRDVALYTDAIYGHVSLVPQLQVQVVDLR